MAGLSRPAVGTAVAGGLVLAEQRDFQERGVSREQGILEETRRP